MHCLGPFPGLDSRLLLTRDLPNCLSLDVDQSNLVMSMLLVWRRQWHPTPVLLPGKSHGRRILEGCSPWGRWGSDTTDQLHFHFSLSCIGEGNGNPVQCSCLENPRDGGTWWAAIYGVTQSWTRLKWLSSRSSSIHLTCPYVLRSFIFFKLEFSVFCITIDNAISLISEKSSYWDIYSANICHMCTVCLAVFWVLGLQRWNQQLSCGKELSV